MSKSTLSIIVGLLFFLQCAPFAIKKSSFTVPHFSGKAQISIVAGEFYANFSADIEFTPNDSFHIKVSGPFGMDVGEVFIINQRYLYLNHLDRQMMNGENKDGLLEKIFQIPVSPDLLSKLFLLPEMAIDSSLFTQFSHYEIKKIIANGRQINEISMGRNEKMMNIRFDKYKHIISHRIPMKIIIEKSDTEKLMIQFKNLKESHKPIGDIPFVSLKYKQLVF
ncbi:MAG: hypothetical protein Kow00108_05220 [Calditrichia bacterium]